MEDILEEAYHLIFASVLAALCTGAILFAVNYPGKTQAKSDVNNQTHANITESVEPKGYTAMTDINHASVDGKYYDGEIKGTNVVDEILESKVPVELNGRNLMTTTYNDIPLQEYGRDVDAKVIRNNVNPEATYIRYYSTNDSGEITKVAYRKVRN